MNPTQLNLSVHNRCRIGIPNESANRGSDNFLDQYPEVGLSPPIWHWPVTSNPNIPSRQARSKVTKPTHYHRACLRLELAWASQWPK